MKNFQTGGQKIHTIDAAGRSLGRVAAETVMFLRGKNRVDFAPNKIPDNRVEIINVAKLKLEAGKLKAKTYSRYSGYPGGLKKIALAELVRKKGGGESLRLAIKGMLPRNKLRDKIMRRLRIVQ